MLNEVTVGRYFDDLGRLLDSLGLKEKPSQTWNCDETGLQFTHNPSCVIAKKGSKTLHARTPNSKENVTVLACMNASGSAMPPMCVVKGKTVKSVQGFATHDTPKDTAWTFQESAWMCDVLGEEWFRHVFLRQCGPARPQVLLLDSHSSHEVVELLYLAQQENIHLVALPPYTTQELQPLDKERERMEKKEKAEKKERKKEERKRKAQEKKDEKNRKQAAARAKRAKVVPSAESVNTDVMQ
ncbi:tigger transposable element-derived protein 2 [Elysia marginata]|uniref:Tigger transposable element-derived protein 2 n=1 Tax=Elysia marginata TaxID=1093978 RepID=A0AAV4F3E9_9GAST|nr:tigger transposable element-derived protein 2 [Elysia marginata]